MSFCFQSQCGILAKETGWGWPWRGEYEMNIPESMKSELTAWNNGQGIDLKGWVGCAGNFSLAVGYASKFWPEFVEIDGYILTKPASENMDCLRTWECQEGATRKATEKILNHFHIADFQYYGCPDISKDKLKLLGQILKEIYEAKLCLQFPESPCIVEFHEPEDEDNLQEYQLSFWQAKHEYQGKSV